MAEGQILMLLIAAWSLVVTLLWLVIGWRAMKAHERIADSVDEIRHAARAFVKSRLDQKD